MGNDWVARHLGDLGEDCEALMRLVGRSMEMKTLAVPKIIIMIRNNFIPNKKFENSIFFPRRIETYVFPTFRAIQDLGTIAPHHIGDAVVRDVHVEADLPHRDVRGWVLKVLITVDDH